MTLPRDHPAPDLPALDEGCYRNISLTPTPAVPPRRIPAWSLVFVVAFLATLLFAAVAWPMVQARIADSVARGLE